MSWIIWLIIIIIGLTALFFISKLFRRNGEVSELDERLGTIKGLWDSVCAKIGLTKVGC